MPTFPSPSANPSLDRPQVPALTGLRFLAALLVLVAHAGQTAFQFTGTSSLFLFWTASACLGMSLFFLLSGFVIHCNYARLFQTETPARALYSFLSNRIARLYPLFFFVLLVNQALVTLGPHLGTYKYLLPQYLTLSQSWVFALTGDGGMSLSPFYAQSWSISVEFFFYLLFPLVVLPISRLGGRDGGAFASPRWALLVWIGALVGAYALVWGFYQTRSLTFPLASMLSLAHPLGEAQYSNWLSYFCPLMRFVEFLVGCLTAQLYLVLRNRPPGRWEKRLGGVMGVLALGAIVFLHGVFSLAPPWTDTDFFRFLRMNFLWGGPLALLIFCCVRYPGVLSRWLDWPVVVLLGDASYSIYLLQIPLLGIFAKGPAPFTLSLLLQRTFTLALALATVLVVAIGTYRSIEDPSRRWLRGFLGRLPALANGPRRLRQAVLAIYLTPVLGLALSFLIYRVSYLPTGFVALARQEQTAGRLQGAVTALDRALRLRPRFVEALSLRAEIQLALGNATAALGDLDRAVQLEPDRAHLWCSHGQAQLLLDEPDKAEADLTRALRLDPDLKAASQLRDRLSQLDLE